MDYPEGSTCSVCYGAGLPQPDYSGLTEDEEAQAPAAPPCVQSGLDHRPRW